MHIKLRKVFVHTSLNHPVLLYYVSQLVVFVILQILLDLMVIKIIQVNFKIHSIINCVKFFMILRGRASL